MADAPPTDAPPAEGEAPPAEEAAPVEEAPAPSGPAKTWKAADKPVRSFKPFTTTFLLFFIVAGFVEIPTSREKKTNCDWNWRGNKTQQRSIEKWVAMYRN